MTARLFIKYKFMTEKMSLLFSWCRKADTSCPVRENKDPYFLRRDTI